MNWWWLSFADDNGFLGAVVVEAISMQDAVVVASQRKINPGGEVLGITVPPGLIPRDDLRYKLLTIKECEEFGPSHDFTGEQTNA